MSKSRPVTFGIKSIRIADRLRPISACPNCAAVMLESKANVAICADLECGFRSKTYPDIKTLRYYWNGLIVEKEFGTPDDSDNYQWIDVYDHIDRKINRFRLNMKILPDVIRYGHNYYTLIRSDHCPVIKPFYRKATIATVDEIYSIEDEPDSCPETADVRVAEIIIEPEALEALMEGASRS